MLKIQKIVPTWVPKKQQKSGKIGFQMVCAFKTVQDASKKLLGGPKKPPRGPQEAPKRPPGGPQEASKTAPRGFQELPPENLLNTFPKPSQNFLHTVAAQAPKTQGAAAVSPLGLCPIVIRAPFEPIVRAPWDP